MASTILLLDEIILTVMSFVNDGKTLSLARGVCRDWHASIDAHALSLLKSLCLSPTGFSSLYRPLKHVLDSHLPSNHQGSSDPSFTPTPEMLLESAEISFWWDLCKKQTRLHDAWSKSSHSNSEISIPRSPSAFASLPSAPSSSSSSNPFQSFLKKASNFFSSSPTSLLPNTIELPALSHRRHRSRVSSNIWQGLKPNPNGPALNDKTPLADVVFSLHAPIGNGHGLLDGPIISTHLTGAVRVFDLAASNDLSSSEKQVLLNEFRPHGKKSVLDAQWIGEYDLIATASSDASIRLCGARDGSVRSTLRGHSSAIFSIRVQQANGSASSPLTLLSTAHDHDARLWDLNTGVCKQVLRAHEDVIYCGRWDGSLAVTASYDGTVIYWDNRAAGPSLVIRNVPPAQHRPLYGMDVCNGIVMCTGGRAKGFVSFVDIRQPHVVAADSIFEDTMETPVLDIIDPEAEINSYIPSSAADCDSAVAAPQTSSSVLEVDHLNWFVNMNETQAVVCSNDRSLQIYDVAQRKCIGRIHTSHVPRSAAFDWNSQAIVYGCDDGSVWSNKIV